MRDEGEPPGGPGGPPADPPSSSNVAPLSPSDVQRLLVAAPFQWWIAGGWALDLFIGESTRPHFDIDVAIPRPAQVAALEAARMRQVDVEDFGRALPHLADEGRAQLREDLSTFQPHHPWLASLR